MQKSALRGAWWCKQTAWWYSQQSDYFTNFAAERDGCPYSQHCHAICNIKRVNSGNSGIRVFWNVKQIYGPGVTFIVTNANIVIILQNLKFTSCFIVIRKSLSIHKDIFCFIYSLPQWLLSCILLAAEFCMHLWNMIWDLQNILGVSCLEKR